MDEFQLNCPIPNNSPLIELAHGSGGRKTKRLIEERLFKAFGNPILNQAHDSALLPAVKGKLAMTTDSYVVKPLFFPGGDIGKLAIYGTVNDLLMCGAKPLWLSLSLIIEEGLPFSIFDKIIESITQAKDEAGIEIVTGDTKVVDKGKGDGIYINTSGIGERQVECSPTHIQEGDVIILSGDIGRHGLTVLTQREGFEMESSLESDCACLRQEVQALQNSGIDIHCMRDLTRGGLASALIELSETKGLALSIEERNIVILPEVRATSELLGLDPLHIANEGRFIAFVKKEDSEKALSVLNEGACVIGEVKESGSEVTLESISGAKRFMTMLTGEALPRIC